MMDRFGLNIKWVCSIHSVIPVNKRIFVFIPVLYVHILSLHCILYIGETSAVCVSVFSFNCFELKPPSLTAIWSQQILILWHIIYGPPLDVFSNIFLLVNIAIRIHYSQFFSIFFSLFKPVSWPMLIFLNFVSTIQQKKKSVSFGFFKKIV